MIIPNTNAFTMAQGSSNFHHGQLAKVFTPLVPEELDPITNKPKKKTMPNLIIGAPGISMGVGMFAGLPNTVDNDGRSDFYQEVIAAADPKNIYFHHWDNFKNTLEDGPLEWFMTSKFMWSRFEWQLRWFDQKYKDAQKIWKNEKAAHDKWAKLPKEQKEDQENHPEPKNPGKKFDSSTVRSFKFLPLFKRVKI